MPWPRPGPSPAPPHRRNSASRQYQQVALKMPRVIRNLISIPGLWFTWQREQFFWNELPTPCRCLQRLIIQNRLSETQPPQGRPCTQEVTPLRAQMGFWKCTNGADVAENAGQGGKSQSPWCLDLREARSTLSSPSLGANAFGLPGIISALAFNVLSLTNSLVPGEKNLKVRKRQK